MAARSVLAILIVTMLLPMAQPALAQQQLGATNVDMGLPNLARPIPPGETTVFNNSVNVRYSYSGGAAGPTTVRIEVVEEPDWLTSTFSPSEIQFSAEPPGGQKTYITNLTLEAAADAPAFAETTAVYRVVAEQNGVLQSAEAQIEFRVVAGFNGRIDVSLPEGETVHAQGGFVTRVPLDIRNQGNGPLLIDVQIVRSPAESKIAPPFEVQVGAGPEDNTTTAYLEIQVPWKVSEKGPVEIRLSPTHATQGTPGRTVEVGFQLDGDSAVPVPGPGPFAVLALAGAVLLARLRQRA